MAMPHGLHMGLGVPQRLAAAAKRRGSGNVNDTNSGLSGVAPAGEVGRGLLQKRKTTTFDGHPPQCPPLPEVCPDYSGRGKRSWAQVLETTPHRARKNVLETSPRGLAFEAESSRGLLSASPCADPRWRGKRGARRTRVRGPLCR